MSDIIETIDEKYAEATPSTWSVSDSGVCGNAGTVCQITPQFTDRGSMRRCDAELITTLVNAWPALRDRLVAAERKARAFDLIASGGVVSKRCLLDENSTKRTWVASTDEFETWHKGDDLLTAIEAATREAKP